MQRIHSGLRVNSYRSTLKYLYGLQGRGMKFGLRNIKALLKEVGNPERTFRSIHVAGTNGKGSTSAFLASIFMEGGYKTGLYTSPHLVRFTERIRINGIEIPEERLVAYARRIRPAVERVHATFFEATTCIAFQYFADEEVDLAVIEAGLGGRLDSTNVLHPLVSVITNVAFDHMDQLGRTLVKIAREKGGIIKTGVPCITASREPVVLATLKNIARKKHARFLTVRNRVSSTEGKSVAGRTAYHFTTSCISLRNVHLGLAGEHQITNAATALAVVDTLRRRKRTGQLLSHLTNDCIKRGLERVTRNTGLRARLERLHGRFILDVAHNEDAMRILTGSLDRDERYVVVFGVMKDKRYMPMLEMLGSVAEHIVAVQPKLSRALSSRTIVQCARRLNIDVTNAGSVRNGVAVARRLAGKHGSILITGSHYVVGEAIQHLKA
jgi:dihydrofolate synthase/folylpolyglutamate synthase